MLGIYGILQKNTQCWVGAGKPKNTNKKDQGSRKRSQLEPKWRPVHEIYLLKTVGKQEPCLMCPQRYHQWMARSRHTMNKGSKGHSSVVGLCSTSVNINKTTFGKSKIWEHLLWIGLYQKNWKLETLLPYLSIWDECVLLEERGWGNMPSSSIVLV